LTTLQEFSRFW